MTKKEETDLLARLAALEKEVAAVRKIFNQLPTQPLGVTSLPKADNNGDKHE
jgi:hypothetical protein